MKMMATHLFEIDKIARPMELPDAVMQRSPHMMEPSSTPLP